MKKQKVLIIVIIVLCIIAFVMTGKLYMARAKKESVLVQNSLQTLAPKASLNTFLSQYLVENQIDEKNIAIAVHDFVSNQDYFINEDQYFFAASLYKLPLAMQYYEAISTGKMKLQDTLPYRSIDYEMGGPIGDTFAPGSKITLETLLEYVILYSDNTAGHILYEQLGGWEVFRKEIKVYSPMKYTDEFQSNSFTVRYTNDVLVQLYHEKESYTSLLDDMQQAYPNDYLNRTKPLGTYQKYGAYEEFRNAIGLAMHAHPYAISVMTSLGEDGIRVIGELNALCDSYFNEESVDMDSMK